MKEQVIKVGYLISYDYKYMEYSLPTVYEYADQITLAVDKDRLTWSGEKFEIPDSFFEWISKYDIDKKIHIYEDSFYVPSMSPIDCDTRERNMLAQAMGEGGWHVQVDADEYFVDFKTFVDFLKSLDNSVSISIYAQLVTIFRQKEADYFLIDSCEIFPCATNSPVYRGARITEKNKKEYYTKYKVLHQSWGRSEQEMAQKLNNWGHVKDFDVKAYFELWKIINRQTYKYIRNFHPLDSPIWKKLEHVEAQDIPTLLDKVKVIQEEKKRKKKQSRSFYSMLFWRRREEKD